MRMPTGWDMDSSMRYPEQWSKTHTENGIFFSRLFANQKCLDFIEAYVNEWQRVLQAGIMEQMKQIAQAFPSTAQGQGLIRSYPLHVQRWNFDPIYFDVESQSASASEWFAKREIWLSSQISELADGLQEIEFDTQTETRKIIADKHIHIIRNGETYSVDGKRIK